MFYYTLIGLGVAVYHFKIMVDVKEMEDGNVGARLILILLAWPAYLAYLTCKKFFGTERER
jgi:hypothetical protein